MNAPIEGRVIRAVDCNSSAFISKWKDLPPNIQIEAKAVLQSLFLLSLDNAPAKLHLHQLRNRQVTSRLAPPQKSKCLDTAHHGGRQLQRQLHNGGRHRLLPNLRKARYC